MTIEELLEKYPEGTAKGFAGYCDELTAWQMIVDVATQVQSPSVPPGGEDWHAPMEISPSCIAINGNVFVLVPLQDCHDDTFVAPELIGGKTTATEKSAVWSLAATVFRMVMGCNIMNGRGGKAQKATSKLPFMRSEMPEMSRLVQQCLDYDASKRPTLAEVLATAKNNLERCKEELKDGPRMKPETASSTSAVEADSSAWPEEMIPT